MRLRPSFERLINSTSVVDCWVKISASGSKRAEALSNRRALRGLLDLGGIRECQHAQGDGTRHDDPETTCVPRAYRKVPIYRQNSARPLERDCSGATPQTLGGPDAGKHKETKYILKLHNYYVLKQARWSSFNSSYTEYMANASLHRSPRFPYAALRSSLVNAHCGTNP